MRKINFKIVFTVLIGVCVLALTSCGSKGYPTLFQQEVSAKESEATSIVEWIDEKFQKIEDLISTEKENLSKSIDTLAKQIAALQAEIDGMEDGTDKVNKTALKLLKEEEKQSKVDSLTKISSPEYRLEKMKEQAIYIVEKYVNFEIVANSSKEDKINKNYKVILLRSDIEKYKTYIENATVAVKEANDDLVEATTSKSSCFGTTTNVSAVTATTNVSSEKDLYRIATIFTAQFNQRNLELEPLIFYTGSQFWSHLFNNLFIFPVGWLLYIISKIFGGYYIVGLVVSTLLVRTLGWPIYAKTNETTLRMQLAQPELNKLQEKYGNRQDPDSQRAMQMEQMQIYKKYKIGFGGCLMPFLQFPIFITIFRAISRLPYTVNIEGTPFTLDWANKINPNFLGLNLFNDRTSGTGQLIWIIVLVILVVGTQFISQYLSEKRQKKVQADRQQDVPEYRRQAVQQNDMQKSMKWVMYFMMFMMGMFVWTSKAALGIYWLIGNLYSMVQMQLNTKVSSKKLIKMQEKQTDNKSYINILDNKSNNKKK